MIKKIIRFSIGLILFLGILLAAIFFYVKGHKEDVANFIVDTIAEKHNGKVSFDDVTLKSWGNFTNPEFYIKKLNLLDSTKDKTSHFEAEDIYLKLSVKSLLKNKIQVKSVRIKNANYSAVIINEDLAALLAKKDTLSNVEYVISENFKPYKMALNIENFNVDLQNMPRKKRINFKINEMSSNLLINEDRISATLDLDAYVSQLGFNLEKGSYLKDSKVKGIMYPEFDLTNNKIHIPTFDMLINDQTFGITADFDTAGRGSFLFNIVNDEIEYERTIRLISEHIQLKLSAYKFSKPISTHTTLKGSFAPLSNPVVHIDFNTQGNTVLINERFDLDDLSFTGSFTNRIYDDARAKTENKKNIKLKFSTLIGNYKESKLELSNGLFTSSPDSKANVKGLFKAEGIPDNLISFINNPSFTFKDGHYNLTATLDGDPTYVPDLLTHSSINLKVLNTNVFDVDDEISAPIEQLDISIQKDKAILEVLKLPFNATDALSVHGEVSQFSSLLTKDAEFSAKTNLHFSSNNFVWEDFVDVFIYPSKGSKEKAERPAYMLHNLASDIYLKFNPSITVNIKSFDFESLRLNDFTTKLRFSDVNHLHLYNTFFKVREGAVKLNATLDFEQSQQIVLDAKMDASGTPEVLNDIFKSDTFFFEGGNFYLDGQVHGDIFQMEGLLNDIKGSVKLVNSNVRYQPNNLILPIDLLDVEINENVTVLKSLEIGIGVGDKLNFSGRLENFSAFLSNRNTNQVNTFIDLHSERLQWNDFMALFQKGVKTENIATESKFNAHIKASLRGIYAKFNPKFSLNIDRFEYKDLIVMENFYAGIHYKDKNSLVLEKSRFDYNKGTNVEFGAQVDLSESAGSNVDVDFKVFGDPLHLNELLNYDTFLLEGGEIEITAKIQGDIEKINDLISASSAKFKIKNSALLHNPSEVRIPFSILEIDIKNNDAFLEALHIELPNKDTIKLSGELKNITSIVPSISSDNEGMRSKFNINSERIELDNFMALFENGDVEKKSKNINKKHALKSVAKDFYHKYQPEISITFDEFIFNKLVLNNFKSGFYFENENLLYLEDTAFDFYNGKVNLDAHLDISDAYKTDFSIGVTTENLDFEKLLVSFDYFNVPSVKEADKIAGKVNMNSRFEGEIIDSTGLVVNSLRGTIDFDLQDLELKGFDPIVKVGNIVFKKKRLEDIRFAPIENTLYFANNRVEFPMMEIQSTAFNFFVTGHLGFGEVPTNLWTALPLSNFKKKDIDNIPDKKAYAEAGNKIYIEAKNGKKGKMKYKLHLSEKKYFKERDSLSVYKMRVKENRLLRKKYKRESRDNKNAKNPNSN
ncbi:MAG: hypothetical protein KC469_02815 [Flavobacteriaceae bacterium]|nr:hypothetical protein [Flavobacteriaceae bacterium]